MNFSFVGFIYGFAVMASQVFVTNKLAYTDEWHSTRRTNFTLSNMKFLVIGAFLYSLIGVSTYLAYVSNAPIITHLVYLISLGLNCAWMLLFFKMHKLSAAFFEATVLWLSVCATIWAVMPYSELAGVFIIPYLIWIGYIILMNYQVMEKDEEVVISNIVLEEAGIL